MNIFVSDKNPIQSAINLDDKRVRHMPKECLEIIRMVIYYKYNIIVGDLIVWDKERRGNKFIDLYEHGCTRWARRKVSHLYWLYKHAIALTNEYQYRFNERHYLRDALIECAHYIKTTNTSPKTFRDSSGMNGTNVIKNYRESLYVKWYMTDLIKPVWTKRDQPNWLNTLRQNQKSIDFNQYNIENDLPF